MKCTPREKNWCGTKNKTDVCACFLFIFLGNYGPIPNFIAGVIMIVVCVVGYIGIQKEKPNYLKPFMFFALLIIVLVLIAVIGAIFWPSRFHAEAIPVLLISAG